MNASRDWSSSNENKCYRQTVFMKCKKFTIYCLAKELFMNFRNFVFETTDRILTSFVKIPFRWYTTQYHKIFRPLKMAPLLCFETSVTGHKMSRYRTWNECKFQLQTCENLKTGKTFDVWDQYQKASRRIQFWLTWVNLLRSASTVSEMKKKPFMPSKT
jgi:hypothetical protein